MTGNATSSHNQHASYHKRYALLYLNSTWDFSKLLHLNCYCPHTWSTPRQRGSSMHLAKPQLHPFTSTPLTHKRVPSLMSQKYPHFPTPRRGLCRQHQPVAHRAFPLHLRINPSIIPAKSCASMGASTICQRGCPGTPEMVLLPSPVEMDSPWISSFT